MALKEFFDVNNQFALKLFQETDKLEKDLENMCLSYKKFIDIGDPSDIISVVDDLELKEKLNCIVSAKRGERKKAVLNDITKELNLESLNIKQEKLSEIMVSEQSNEYVANIKQEKEDMMPPPMKAPPKKRKFKQEVLNSDNIPKRSTRTRSRMKNTTVFAEESFSVGGSDIMLVENTITTVNLVENSFTSSKDKDQSEPEICMRNTRSKTANKKKLVENSTDDLRKGVDVPVLRTRTRVLKTAKEQEEDSKQDSNHPISLEVTRTNRKDNIPSDVTFTVPEANPQKQVVDDLSPSDATFTMTKGGPINSTVANESPKVKKPENPPKTEDIPLRKKQAKELFSPYKKTPLKMKVEAFELLTKKKGTMTPLSEGSAMKLKGACSTYKTNRRIMGKVSSECLTNSGLKSSQAEFREREKRRLEKEQEALRKREALLQAQTEEKRKKREEKQLKAQQQRGEYMEKEKLKFLEIQKAKEERIKKANAEKEEKLQKQKEEAERKRMKVKMNKTERAIYMTTPMPLLPTEDPYDSDDPNYKTHRRYIPEWCRDAKAIQYAMLYAGQTIKNSLFSRQIQTPSLLDIFEDTDPKDLQRTSSAAWKSPPRYTFFSMTQDTTFSESESDD